MFDHIERLIAIHNQLFRTKYTEEEIMQAMVDTPEVQ